VNTYEVLQNLEELDWFVDLLKREEIKSYLEIGSKFGGTFWHVASSMPFGSRAVTVDLPGATIAWPESKHSLTRCRDQLIAQGIDAQIIWGDSTDPKVVEHVQALGPFDACFIDANHYEKYVSQDFKNYGALSRIVAFHDIGWKPLSANRRKSSVQIEVPAFWNRIKKDYRHEEINLEPADNGIGVLWRC